MAVPKGRASVAHETKTVKVGDRAPDFELVAHDTGERWRLAEHAGKTVVLAFYPFAFSPT